jgi:hypothetical protein
MTAKRLRKCRAVDGEGKPKPGFPAQPTSPWKSLLRFPHSRSPGHDRHGKVEIQKQDSHFPTATSLSLSNQSKMKGDQPQPKTLSFRLISGLEYAHMGCEEKNRLTLEYEEATAKFAAAVTEFQRKTGTSPKKYYERLNRTANESRVKIQASATGA